MMMVGRLGAVAAELGYLEVVEIALSHIARFRELLPGQTGELDHESWLRDNADPESPYNQSDYVLLDQLRVKFAKAMAAEAYLHEKAKSTSSKYGRPVQDKPRKVYPCTLR